MTFRIGFGTDIHRLIAGRRLILGGVEIPSDLGAEGHSDADVLFHAVTDAVLGAAGLGDIGLHFPENEGNKDAASIQFLRRAVILASEKGLGVVNADTVIELEAPKLRPYIEAIRAALADALGVSIEQVNIKAKTGELVDSVGERRAIRCQAIVLLTGIS